MNGYKCNGGQMAELKHGGDIYSKRNIPLDKKLVDFSANINPLGLPAAAKKAILENMDAFSSYPDPICRDLVKVIAEKEGVPEEYIICGNGAADLIYRLAAGIKPGSALVTAPAFSEYEDAVKAFGGSISYFPLEEEKDFNLDQSILKHITPGFDLMFLCNPNNPTGGLAQKELILEIAQGCKACNTILAVDECFMDFLEDGKEFSIIDRLDEFDNVVVIKAFTKIYAMAGIRLGYAISSNPAITGLLNASGQPWSVSTVAQKCGIAAVGESGYLSETRRLIKVNRGYLADELQKLGMRVYQAAAGTNYILFRTETAKLAEELEQYGILIRSCGNYKGLDESYFRIAVKAEEDNEYLIECLKEIFNRQK